MSPGIDVDGISLQIDQQAQYLEALWQVLNQTFPYMISPIAAVEKALGSPPRQADPMALRRTLPYTAGMAIALVDREWFDAADNEFDCLIGYLESHRLFGPVRSVFIWGAGPCRLGDYFAAKSETQSVVCADISWLILYCGKALIERQINRLPKLLQRDRTYYEIDRQMKRLLCKTKTAVFKAPRSLDPAKVQYVVQDAFYGSLPAASELVCLPFLLDHFDGARMLTMLIRICQSMRVGQDLFILMSCAPSRRNPALVIETLEHCGFRIECMELAELPYTASYYDFSHFRNFFNTLVIRARCATPAPMEEIVVLNRLHDSRLEGPNSDGSVKVNTGRDREIIINRRSAMVFAQCQDGHSYEQVFNRVAKKLDRLSFEQAIGELTAGELIDLAIRPTGN